MIAAPIGAIAVGPTDDGTAIDAVYLVVCDTVVRINAAGAAALHGRRWIPFSPVAAPMAQEHAA